MMVRKKLAIAIATVGALQANLAVALGLGDFSLDSALNQPLNAEIELLNTADLDPSQVIVKLGSADDFQRAGISREYFLTNINFTVEIDANGRGRIKLKTQDPVREPYLDLIIEARWPAGRLLREYTVLLDLPIYTESDPQSVSSAGAGSARTATQPSRLSQPDNASVGSDSSRRTLNQGRLAAGEDYRVQKNDTLWEIAAQSRPDNRVSVQQAMLSIQRNNPDAFISGNINRLKAGYVLRLPAEQEAANIDSASAISEVAQQNRAWRDDDSAADVGGAPLDATSSYQSEGGSANDSGRLSIAAAGDSSASAAGEGAGAGGTSALRDQLSASAENLDKAERDNGELQSRLGDMEAKIATLQRLLELKEDQLAALQVTAGEAGVDVDTMAGAEPAEDVAAAMQETEMSAEPGDSAQPGDEADTAATDGGMAEQQSEPEAAADAAVVPPTVEEDNTAKPAESAPAKPAPQAEPGFIDMVMSNLLYIGGALLVLILGAVALIMRRRQDDDEVDDELDDDFVLPVDESDDEHNTVAFDTLGLDDNDETVAVDTDLIAAEMESLEVEDDAPASPQPVRSETGDAISEADIYIAYGRYQQAVDLLRNAIAAEPARSDLRLKLLEVFVETRDKPGFQQQYLELQAMGDDAAVGQAKEILSTVDGVEDWLDGLASAPVTDEQMDAELIEGEDDSVDLGDLDLDLDFDTATSGTTQEMAALDLDIDGPESASDDDLSLDLDDTSLGLDDVDLDFDSEPDDETTQVQPIVDAGLDDDLDLELDDLGLDDSTGNDIANAPVAEADDSMELELDSDDFDLSLDELELDTDEDLAAEFGSDAVVDNEPTLATNDALDSTSDPNEPDDEFDLDFNLEDDTMAAVDTVPDTAPEVSLDDEFAELAAESDLELDLTDTVSEETDAEAPHTDAPMGDLPSIADEPVVDEFQPEEPAPLREMAPEPDQDDDDFDFLSDTDEVATKLDLARAYIDMGDADGAKDILQEVLQEGNDAQKQEASSLMERVD